MRRIETMDEFTKATLDAGLGPMSEDELTFLKNYYDGAALMTERLAAIVTLEDEPATTFHPGWIRPD